MTHTVFLDGEADATGQHARVRGSLALLVVLMMVALVSACGVNAREEHVDEWSKWQREKFEKAKAVELFPEAAEVRMFANKESVGWDERGTFRAGTFPSQGALLTAAEVRRLREAVRETPPPPAEAACCIPRHAFVFLDRNGERLGALRVCFECTCASISEGDALQITRQLQWLDWDEKVIGDIVRAHGVPLFEEDQAQ